MLSTPLFYAGIVHYGSSFLYVLLIILYLVILPLAFIYSLYGTALHLLKTRFTFLNLLLPPSLWVIADYLREMTDFFIPWGFIGYSQVYTPFIQIADITGIYGVSFIIVYTNYVLAQYIVSRQKKIINLVPLTILITAVFVYGIIKEKKITGLPETETINITGVQGNTGSLDRWDSSLSFMTYRNYIELTTENHNSNGIVIWPETVLNSSDRVNFEIMKSVNSLIGDESLFITGGTRKDADGNTFNSIFISSRGILKHIYDKKILFPYSERRFAGLSHGSIMGSPDTFAEGDSSPLFRHGNFTIGLSVCFESLYPSYIRNAAAGGADILINVANDSWFGNTYEPHMHLYSNIVRAVENRRFIARVTNSGVSAIITPSGRLADSLDLNKEGVISGTSGKTGLISFYTIFGDLIIIFAALIVMSGITLYILSPAEK